LFENVFSHAGQIRQYNITKKEWVLKNTFKSVNSKVPKSHFDTLECTLEELAVLELISKNPFIKQNELVTETGKSLSTIKRIMESLQKKQYIRRVNGKRYGNWEVLINLNHLT